MKKTVYILFTSVLFLFGCFNNEPLYQHKYNTDPTYTWGYAQFYGAYYADYGNENNVVSLSLFSDSLNVDSDGDLGGTGQYLYLEDIFLNPTDTVLASGTYVFSNSGEPYTITPGSISTIDGNQYQIGSYIYYIESNSDFTAKKLISRGSITFGENQIQCDLVLADSTNIKGHFSGSLPYIIYKTGVAKNTKLLSREQIVK